MEGRINFADYRISIPFNCSTIATAKIISTKFLPCVHIYSCKRSKNNNYLPLAQLQDRLFHLRNHFRTSFRLKSNPTEDRILDVHSIHRVSCHQKVNKYQTATHQQSCYQYKFSLIPHFATFLSPYPSYSRRSPLSCMHASSVSLID